MVDNGLSMVGWSSLLFNIVIDTAMTTSKQLRRYARRMKRRPSPTELVFKRRLQYAGIEFKSQVVVGFYIADFCFPSKMLIIELDGDSHKNAKAYDKRRDEFLKMCGFEVWRVKNEDMRSVDVSLIGEWSDYPADVFRSALGRANALKGNAMKKRKMARRSLPDIQPPSGILDRYFHRQYLGSFK